MAPFVSPNNPHL